jgi:hypothetical protein
VVFLFVKKAVVPSSSLPLFTLKITLENEN